ncbi:MAG: AAA family ATPase, partial [Caulobacterales bacterium]|uniref:AAA family ATPase n=1 Tax=Glycocaulis sp. TaxID=1969725 RepID=UPI003FA02FDB
LAKEQRRLEAQIGLDQLRRKQYDALTQRIARLETAISKRQKEIDAAAGADSKIAELISRRDAVFRGILQQVDKEAAVLTDLYSPLQNRMSAAGGTVAKLQFSVMRHVDIDSWAEAGEALIDKVKKGAFRGIGTLKSIVSEELAAIWSTGTPDEIAKAISKFREKYRKEFWNHIPEHAQTSKDARLTWANQISEWMLSIDHVSVKYGIKYEGVDIQRLSPGTRGIVLLLLYLSLDTDDLRPLIIDQPEENLDPKSIYEELVPQFKSAKQRRQIIIVTHNANLVVNTDADQVIIAARGELHENKLPEISYLSGGLENPQIREEVCLILEGGERAFSERARRLNIGIS